MERGLNGRRKEIGRGGKKIKSEITGENLSSERADGNIKKTRIPKAELWIYEPRIRLDEAEQK